MMEQKTIKKIIGLRNIVTDGIAWKNLLFYEIDNPTVEQLEELKEDLDSFQISYIVYRTKNGVHAVGLTPIEPQQWGYMFQHLKEKYNEYYSGETIRLSRKKDENQLLIWFNIEHPFIANLFSIYTKRFQSLSANIEEHDQPYNMNHYKLVFEKYWTVKE